jgi:flagellar hook assembly protein FlgD
MAQFSALEAMSEMSAGFMASQAYNMIGKYVYVQDGSDLVYGKVSGVVSEDGVNYLMIGDKYFDAKNVTGVMDPSAVESDLDEQILQSANLIGKTITAQIADEGSETTTTVSGVVEKLIVKDGAVYAVVDETNVPISNITEIE